jgi:cytochrome c oxidase cbb3-type subunit 3
MAHAAATLALAVLVRAAAQERQPPPQQPSPRTGPGADRERAEAFPAHQRPQADPAVIERGSTLYGLYCRLCHGPDLRGGDMGGVNLLRSQLVLNDEDGEKIGPVILQGRSNGPALMPPVPLPPEDAKAVAAYIRSVTARAARQGGPPPGEAVTLNIVVGDAALGERYFAKSCASCHSATGDLQGVGTRYPEPMALQNVWVSGNSLAGRRGPGGPDAGDRPVPEGPPPRRPKPVTVKVTTPDGRRVEGKLEHIDDFVVALTEADGAPRSFRRAGAVPLVELVDPLDGHKKLLTQYTDKDIHDVTAYLVTLK